MMIDFRTLDDLSQRLGALLPPSLGEAREDLTRNFRSALQAGLQRLVLRRTREKLEALERRLAEMERSSA